jgi:hypothetical protein
MDMYGVNSQARYVISRSWKTIGVAPQVLSQGREGVNVWRRAARMNVKTVDRVGEVIRANRRSLGTAARVISSIAPNMGAARRMIQSLSGIYR